MWSYYAWSYELITSQNLFPNRMTHFFLFRMNCSPLFMYGQIYLWDLLITIEGTILIAGVWEEHVHWFGHNFLCWWLLLSILPSIQFGNKWSMGHLKERGSSLVCLYCIFLLLSLLFCHRYHSKHHLPLLPCTKFTQIIF